VTFLQQSTFRSFIDPSWTLNHLGFRCALDAGDDDNGESRDDLIDTLTKVIITPDKEKDQSSTELGNTPTPILPIELSDLDIGSMFVSPLDGTTMFYIPAGEFEMGSNVDEAVYDEKPIHTVYLDAFWIDQTEVTNAMYAKCVGAGRCEPPSSSRSYSRDSYYGIPEFDDYPVIYVSWHDAQAYCAWAGKRLPTEAEWDKAASWDEKNRQKFIYPWGNSIDCSLANYWGREEGCIGDTIEVGSYQDGQSPYGVLDMTGNVIEWVADWYDEEYYAISPPSNPLGPDDGEFRVVRGGSWANPGAMVRVSYRFIPLYPIGSYDSLGFRCALNASVDGKTSIDHIDTPSADFDDGETASGNIVITGVFYNGVNGSQEPDEYVEIRNTGTEAIQLRDWSLIDESHHEFIFPRFIMEPGQICRIYTNEEHREWCSFNYRSTGSAIWNNDGDCAKLRSTDGLVIDEYCY
jgi:formylglycine-generating enzyme required for sulfatase activity